MVSSIVEPQLASEFGSDSALAVASGPGFASTMLNMNNERPPFDNPDVRRAIGLAIDPQELIDTVLLGTGTAPNPGFLHPDSPNSSAPSTHEYDPEAAAALLDDIGATEGADGIRVLDGQAMSFEMLVYADDPSRIRTAEILSEQLGTVGIDAQVTPLEAETVDEQVWPGFDVVNGRDYAMAIWGWSAPVQLDAGRFGALLHSDPTIGTLNVTGLADPEVDALVDEATSAPSIEERATLIGELEELVGDVRPFVMLYYQDGAYAYRPETFDGWVYQDGQGPLGKISLVAGS
jgi:peptide/nickel transport system substrate-binding protein